MAPPAPVSQTTRSYGRKRKIPIDDSTDAVPAQKLSTEPAFPTSTPQEPIDSNTHMSASPIEGTTPSTAPVETTYDEQKKVRGGRAKRQNQQFNGSNSSHELKTTASNNNDILPSAFDATSAISNASDQVEKTDCDGGVDEFEKPSVKLVISKKKGSIFKSRAIEGEAGENMKQKRHVYKHKWDDDVPEDEKGTANDA